MANHSLLEELDEAIDFVIAHHTAAPPRVAPAIDDLLQVAAGMRHVARPEFKAQLKAALRDPAATVVMPQHVREAAFVPARRMDDSKLLPTLFGTGYGTYAVQRRNFAASFAVHAAAIAAVLGSSLWIAPRVTNKEQVISLITEPSPYVLPTAPAEAGGGGGGGDRDKIQASKGALPKFAMQQVTPAMRVIRNENPKLTAQATVVVPPQVQIDSSMPLLGDPMSHHVAGPPSNGVGGAGGIGSASGGGVGSGTGPGIGLGAGGGIGGGIYHVGGGVSAPKTIYSPDPEYSDEARHARYQGTVILSAIVGPDGRAHEIRVARSLGMGLDEKAIQAVRNWKFEPAKKDGIPVPVAVNIEVNFRMY